MAEPKYVLTEVSYLIELAKPLNKQRYDELAHRLLEPGDQSDGFGGQAWTLDEDRSDYFWDEATCRLDVPISVRPCTESTGVEGNIYDLDHEPDNDEVPAELRPRLARARAIAAEYGGKITDGTWASEYTASSASWDDPERRDAGG